MSSNYNFLSDRLHITDNSGSAIALQITSTTGQIVYRKKIDTVFGVDHPGIELGVDQYGNKWVLHHHYEHVYPIVDREDLFSKGQPIYYDTRPVAYDRLDIVARALDAWKLGKEYHWLKQNCQHFVSSAANGVHKSEAVENISDGAMWTALFLSIAGVATKNKGLLIAAAGIAAGSGIAKAINRSGQ